MIRRRAALDPITHNLIVISMRAAHAPQHHAQTVVACSLMMHRM
jgi:hypothetical protein